MATVSLLMTTGATPSRAQDVGDGAAPEARITLTLAQTIARAEARAPDVVMAHHAVREAEAHRVGAGIVLPANPRLSVDVRPPVSDGTVRESGYGALLDMPFEAGGAPAARVREADRGAELARSDLAVERLRARAAAWTAYVRTRVARERIAELAKSIAIAEGVLAASKQRALAGASGDIDQSLATAEVAQFQATMKEAERLVVRHEMSLRGVLDLSATPPIDLVTSLDEPPEPPDESRLLALALNGRPELVSIRRRLVLLAATDERLGKEVFPRLGVYVGVDAAPLSPIFGVLGLTIELPVAQRNQGPRARVDAARAGELERLGLQGRRIALEVTAARRAYEAALAELRYLTETAFPASQRTLEFVEIGWRSGRFDIFRVTTAARDFARIRGLKLDALEAVWLERIALDYAVGGLEA